MLTFRELALVAFWYFFEPLQRRRLVLAHLALTIAFVLLVLLPFAAVAQAPSPSAATIAVQSYAVDLSPILTGILLPVVSAVVAAILPMLIVRLINLMHLTITQQQMAAIQSAAQNAASFAVAKATAAGQPLAHIALHDPTVAAALQYMATNMPDTLAKAGLSEEQLTNIVTAKIAQVSALAIGAAPCAPAPVKA